MREDDERIRAALAEIDHEDRAPGFEELWGRARDRAGLGRERWRRLLPIPVLGAAALMAILVVLLAPAGSPERTARDDEVSLLESLEGISIPALEPLPSDGLTWTPTRAEDVDRELLLAWNETSLGAQTDWLLTIELTAWDQ